MKAGNSAISSVAEILFLRRGKRRRATTAMAMCMALSLNACGGGSEKNEAIKSSDSKSFAVFGDSYGYGGYFDPPGVLARYSPDPVEMIGMFGLTVHQRSHNGMRLLELMQGGRIERGVPEVTGAVGVYIPPLSNQLQDESATHIVMAVGMADAMFSDVSSEAFRQLVRGFVDLVRAHEKAPVFRGFELFLLNEVITPERMARRDLFDAILREEATSLGVPYIDVASLNELGMANDGVHKTKAANERIAAFIAATLAKL